MLLVGGGTRYRQVPGGRVEEHSCPHCGQVRTFVECTRVRSIEVWFIDVYKDTERVLVCSECSEEIELAATAEPRVERPARQPVSPNSSSVEAKLAAMKQQLATDVPPTQASATTTLGTCVLFDRHALSCAPSELAKGTTCGEQASLGNVFFAWVPKPPATIDLVLRVGLEVSPELQQGAKVVRDRFLRVPTGRLCWGALEAPDAAVELAVPMGSYLVDAWLRATGARRWGGLFGATKHVLAVRLRRTDAPRGEGGGIP